MTSVSLSQCIPSIFAIRQCNRFAYISKKNVPDFILRKVVLFPNNYSKVLLSYLLLLIHQTQSRSLCFLHSHEWLVGVVNKTESFSAISTIPSLIWSGIISSFWLNNFSSFCNFLIQVFSLAIILALLFFGWNVCSYFQSRTVSYYPSLSCLSWFLNLLYTASFISLSLPSKPWTLRLLTSFSSLDDITVHPKVVSSAIFCYWFSHASNLWCNPCLVLGIIWWSNIKCIGNKSLEILSFNLQPNPRYR